MTGRTTPTESPRLLTQRDPLGRALLALESHAREPRPQAQARVWRKLSGPSRRRSPLSGSLFSWLSGRALYLKYLLPAAAAMCLALLVLARGHFAEPAARWSLRRSEGPVALLDASASREAGRSIAGDAADGVQDASSLADAQAPRAGETLPENAALETGESAQAALDDGRARLSLSPRSRLELRGAPRLVSGQLGVTVLESHTFTLAAGAYIVEGGAGSFSVQVTPRLVRVEAASAQVAVRGSFGSRHEVPAGFVWTAGESGERLERRAISIDARSGPVTNSRSDAATHSRSDAATDARGEPSTDSRSGPALDSRGAAGARGGAAAADAAEVPGARIALYHPAADADPLRDAEAKEGRGDYAGAEAIYQALARESGPRAAAALYSLARLRLRYLRDPRGALASLDEETRRFPSGPLSQEVALTEVEARLDLRDDAATLRAMDGFLGSYAESERAAEVRWLRASLELRSAGCASAKSDLDVLAAGADLGFAGEASFARALCSRRAGDEATARAQLRDYLRRFPRGPHAREAGDALAQEVSR